MWSPIFKEAYCAAEEPGRVENFYLKRWLGECWAGNGLSLRLREACILLRESGADAQCFSDAVNGKVNEELACRLASVTAKKSREAMEAGNLACGAVCIY